MDLHELADRIYDRRGEPYGEATRLCLGRLAGTQHELAYVVVSAAIQPNGRVADTAPFS